MPDFRTKYEGIITKLRNAGLRMPLVIDADRWGRNGRTLVDNGPALLKHDPDSNLIFSWHPWDPVSWMNGPKDSIESIIDASIEKNICMIIGEFGPCENCNKCSSTPIEWEFILQYCTENKLGWLAWVWSNNDCHSVVTGNPGYYGDWNGSWGLKVSKYLNNSVMVDQVAALNNNLVFYPNPAHDKITFKNSLDDLPVLIRIYSSLGEIVKTIRSDEIQYSVDIHNLRAGLYVVEVTGIHTFYRQKLVIW
jgi:hypothetical protein